MMVINPSQGILEGDEDEEGDEEEVRIIIIYFAFKSKFRIII